MEINLQTILTRLNIEQLSPMQQRVWEAGRKGDDLILLSPTGTGKTLAFLLPLVEALRPGMNGVQAVVLVPSRELALQIEQVFKAMGTGFKVMSCYGGRPAMEEHRTMNSLHPDVIIGTPGRMNDHLNKQNFDAETVRLLVIDEFDKSLELGFQEEMAAVNRCIAPAEAALPVVGYRCRRDSPVYRCRPPYTEAELPDGRRDTCSRFLTGLLCTFSH